MSTDTPELQTLTTTLTVARSVGFCNPPVATRWKKGQSGNPSGRPKRHQQHIMKDALTKALGATIRDPRDPTHYFTQLEYLVQSLFEQAIKGDNRAAAQIIELTFSQIDEDETVSNRAYLLNEMQARFKAPEAETGKLPPPGKTTELTGIEQGKDQGSEQGPKLIGTGNATLPSP